MSTRKRLKIYFFLYEFLCDILVEIGKTRNCVKTLHPSGVVFPHNFSFSQFALVLILYINTENVLYLLNIQWLAVVTFFANRKLAMPMGSF
jgi:hypothetical protein